MAKKDTHEELEQRILELERSCARLERERDESRERFQAVFEGSRDAVFISNAEARFVHVNRAACALTGYAGEDLLSMRIPDLHAPEDLHAFERHFDDIMSGASLLSEALILRKDGSRVPTEFSNARITIGGRHHMHTTARDITERKRAEEILKVSERRYRRIVEAINEVLYSVDADGVVTYVSPQVENVLGYAPVEIAGERFIRLVHPQDRSAIRQAFEEVLQGRIRPREYRMRGKDGAYRWVRTSSHPDREGGRVVGLHGVLSDVTERRRTEEALVESETRYRSVFENAGTATVIIEDDRTISMANPEFERLSGYARSEVEGRMKWTEFVGPRERERMEAFHRQRRRSEEKAPGEYEFEFVDRSGETKHVHNKIGVIPGTRKSVASLTDMTNRKRAEEALRESEEKYRQLVQHAPAGIYEFDLENMRFLGVNDVMCHYTGYSEEEFLSLDPFQLLCEESRQTLNDLLADVGAGNRNPDPVEYRVRGKNGRSFWVLARASFFFEQGVPRRATAVVHDITERKQSEMEKQRLEAQLRQSQKMEAVGTLAGGIAHDFNNILSAIVGYTEMARMDLPQGAVSGKSLDEVLKASERAKDLVRQILAFSRRTEHDSKALRVEPVVKEALRMLRSSLPSSIDIRWTIRPALPAIIGDPTRIHQILMNLCTNAAQAIEDEQGVIEVRLEEAGLDELGAAKVGDLPPGRYIRLTVRDTGIGMPPDVRERIFDPYFTTKEAGEGTGLGLAVVYGIVSDYGGGVTVESEVGQGSRFSLFLPVAESEASSPPDADRPPMPRGRGEHLLFVDDEPAIAKLGRQYFERLGYRVTASQSSPDALELFRTNPHRFDLVITDMTMPRMSGDELAAAMLSIRPDLPIVLCTGYSQRISEARAREIGIRAYVTKPTTDNELANAVRRVLDGMEP